MSDYFDHCLIEFAVAYDVVMVAIDFRHDLRPKLIIALLERDLAETTMEDSAQFFFADNAVTVLIKNAECDAQIFRVEQASTVDGCGDKLPIINLIVLVRVQLMHEVVPVLRTSTHSA